MAGTRDERKARQLALMRERVKQFRAGGIGIGPTIAGLEALLNEMEDAPVEWHDAFLEQWEVLETAYAVALDAQTPLPTASDWDIAEALTNMDELIATLDG
jgi:hypothetical protein